MLKILNKNESKLIKKYSKPVKRCALIFGIFFLIIPVSNQVCSQISGKIKKVVIDPGHGGKDPGAIGKNSKEKNIVLSVALKAGKMIQDSLKDVQVIYTRKTDVFIELHKRAQIANESGADVFISIHCNSNKSTQPHGTETYVMGLHKSQANLEVAKTENAAIYFEDDYKDQYEGFDPNSDEDYIVLSMFQSATIDQSIDLSSKVQNEFGAIIKNENRGVKQAGFWVLYKTTMPGILVELGFLSNPVEEKYLMSDQGQNKMVFAIFEAFKAYKIEYEDANKPLKPFVIQKDETKPQVFYRVQFASYKKKKDPDFKKFRGLDNIKMYEEDGYVKYTSGNEISFAKAKDLKESLKERGFKDAFIVAFLNDKKISITEAKQLAEKQN